jgi:hypothetical protein
MKNPKNKSAYLKVSKPPKTPAKALIAMFMAKVLL